MKSIMAPLAAALAALAMVFATGAGRSAPSDEQPVQLKPGPGLEQVENNCAACHSLDYIVINSRFMDAKTWDAEVAKMIKTFGAPIDDADAAAIAAYLKQNYGT